MFLKLPFAVSFSVSYIEGYISPSKVSTSMLLGYLGIRCHGGR